MRRTSYLARVTNLLIQQVEGHGRSVLHLQYSLMNCDPERIEWLARQRKRRMALCFAYANIFACLLLSLLIYNLVERELIPLRSYIISSCALMFMMGLTIFLLWKLGPPLEASPHVKRLDLIALVLRVYGQTYVSLLRMHKDLHVHPDTFSKEDVGTWLGETWILLLESHMALQAYLNDMSSADEVITSLPFPFEGYDPAFQVDAAELFMLEKVATHVIATQYLH